MMIKKNIVINVIVILVIIITLSGCTQAAEITTPATVKEEIEVMAPQALAKPQNGKNAKVTPTPTSIPDSKNKKNKVKTVNKTNKEAPSNSKIGSDVSKKTNNSYLNRAVVDLIVDGNGDLVATFSDGTYKAVSLKGTDVDLLKRDDVRALVIGILNETGMVWTRKEVTDIARSEAEAVISEYMAEQATSSKAAEEAAKAAAEAAAAAAAQAGAGYTINCKDGVHLFTAQQYNFLKGFWEHTGDWEAYAHKHTKSELIQICQIEGGIN